MKMKRKLILAFMTLIMTLTAAAYAEEYNFYEQADLKGCLSVITKSGQEECARVQKAKDDACMVSVETNVDKQVRTIATYNETKDRLDRGQVADADKDKLKETVRLLKEQLDTVREDARRGISIAQNCVTARENVQKWFMETGIPLTERTRDDALRIRKDLLDQLANTQKKQADAKSNRDAKPGDSSAVSEYDRATDEMRNAEKALEQFNNKYGKDIERYASKLIEHYKSEKASHETPLTEAKNRVENCRKIADMSY